jgi:hypothetical protein
MHPADILKTAIITPFGLFEFLRLTFGLRNPGRTFKRLMDRVLAGLAFVFVYLDNIIIASPSMEQHQPDVEEVFRRLQVAGLVINFEKCTFAVPEWISRRQAAAPRPPLLWFSSRSILRQLRLRGVLWRRILVINVRVCEQ